MITNIRNIFCPGTFFLWINDSKLSGLIFTALFSVTSVLADEPDLLSNRDDFYDSSDPARLADNKDLTRDIIGTTASQAARTQLHDSDYPRLQSLIKRMQLLGPRVAAPEGWSAAGASDEKSASNPQAITLRSDSGVSRTSETLTGIHPVGNREALQADLAHGSNTTITTTYSSRNSDLLTANGSSLNTPSAVVTLVVSNVIYTVQPDTSHSLTAPVSILKKRFKPRRPIESRRFDRFLGDTRITGVRPPWSAAYALPK